MKKVKEKMKEVIESQPDDATYEEILRIMKSSGKKIFRMPVDF